MGNKPTKAKQGGFAVIDDDAHNALKGRPSWWRFLHQIAIRRRDFKTDAYRGSYAAIQATLSREFGIERTINAIRYAVDQLEQLGLLARDREVNKAARRLTFIVQTQAKQTRDALLAMFRTVFGRCANGRITNEKPPAFGRPLGHGYQKNPSDSFIQKKTDLSTGRSFQGTAFQAFQAFQRPELDPEAEKLRKARLRQRMGFPPLTA